MDIVKKSFEYYDSSVETIFSGSYIINGNIIQIGKEKYTCNDIGSYINKNKTWTWSWAIPTKTFEEIDLGIKLLNYAFSLEPNSDENIYLKSELLTSTIDVKNIRSLDKYISIACYLTKRKKVIIAYNYYSQNRGNEVSEKYTSIEMLDMKSDFVLTVFIIE
jgi:hypothetical protein